jgi:hypothetical protein
MPLVKIFTMNSKVEDDYYSRNEIAAGVTDWEEITKEELTLLRSYAYSIPGMRGNNALIVCQNEISTVEALTSIRDFLDKEQKRRDAETKKNAARIAAAKRTRAEKELAKLKQLAEKHGVDIAIPNPGGS